MNTEIKLQGEESKIHKRGFASMTKEQRAEIARKGGLAISQNREHMAHIGSKGGKATRQQKQIPDLDTPIASLLPDYEHKRLQHNQKNPNGA